ncbi:spore photoproduct lyase family protein, partial [Streptomyces nigra]
MHHASGVPDDDSGTLFGLDALGPAPAPAERHSAFRTSAGARRLLPVRRIYAEPAAAASPRGQQIIAR